MGNKKKEKEVWKDAKENWEVDRYLVDLEVGEKGIEELEYIVKEGPWIVEPVAFKVPKAEAEIIHSSQPQRKPSYWEESEWQENRCQALEQAAGGGGKVPVTPFQKTQAQEGSVVKKG